MKKQDKGDYLNLALRLCEIELHKDLVNKIVDLLELIEWKEGETNSKDIIELKNTLKPTYGATI